MYVSLCLYYTVECILLLSKCLKYINLTSCKHLMHSFLLTGAQYDFSGRI